MAWDAGSIESRLDVDLSPFRHGLDEAKAEAREFADKRYTTTVDIDTKRSSDELAAVEQRLRGIESTVDRIGTKTGGRGGGAGGGGFLSRFAGANVPNASWMSLGIGAAVPAAVPLAGVGLGAGASLLAPTLAGGIGLGAFGAGAKSSIATVQKDVAQLTKLTQQYNAATTDKQRAAALAKEAALWKSLDPAQRGAVKNVQGLEAAWKGYQKALEPQSFRALADGAKIGATGLGLLLPVAKAVGNEVDVLEKGVQRALGQPFWKDFFGRFLTSEAPAAVDALGRTVGNVVTGIGHLAEEFSPLGIDLEQLMVRSSARFERWTQGEGPGKFVAWVQKEGPQVGKTLQALATGVAGIGKGLAPIGAVELKALTPVLNFIGKLGEEHPAVITAVGAALLTVGAGLKAINLAQGAAGVLGKLRGLLGGGGAGGGGVAGKAVDALAGRGSITDPLYVIVLDKTNGPGVPTGGKPSAPGEGEVGKLKKVGSVLGSATVIGTAAITFDQLANAFAPSMRHYLQVAMNPQTPRDRAQQSMGQTYIAKNYPNIPVGSKDYYSAVAQAIQHTGGRSGFVGDFKLQGIPASELSKAARDAAGPAGAAGASVGDALNRGVDRAIRSRLGPLASTGARVAVAQIAKNAATAASSGGESLGEHLGDGMALGILVHKAKVANAAGQLTNAALGKIRQLGDIASPSKVTIQYGKWLAEGLAVGFTGYTSNLTNAIGKSAGTALGNLGTQVNNAANQYRTDLQGRAQLSQSVASGLMGNASLANASLSNTGGATVSGFLGGQIRQLTPFKAALDKLRARHLDPRLLQQVEEAEASSPGRGLMLAQQILSGESISGLNKQERQIASLTTGIGNTVAGATYAGTLNRDQKALEAAARAMEKFVTKRLDLSAHSEQMMERAFAQALKKAFPSLSLSQLDHALGVRLTQVP